MNDDLFAGRGYIWKHTLPMLRDTALIGRGHGAFPLDFPQNAADMARVFPEGSQYVDRPHNLYLQVAHGSGDIAALIFGLGIVWTLWRAWCSRLHNAIALCAGVAGYAVAAFVDDPGVAVNPVFFVLWGAAIAAVEAD